MIVGIVCFTVDDAGRPCVCPIARHVLGIGVSNQAGHHGYTHFDQELELALLGVVSETRMKGARLTVVVSVPDAPVHGLESAPTVVRLWSV